MKTTPKSLFIISTLALVLSGRTFAATTNASATATLEPHGGYIFQEFTWIDAPASLPKGAQMALLESAPNKAGMFTVRLKLPAGYRIPPHWHPADEHVTVISGLLNIAMAPNYDSSHSKAMGAGSFALMPAKMHHAAWADVETVIQLHGVGPWQINYVNPADKP